MEPSRLLTAVSFGLLLGCSGGDGPPPGPGTDQGPSGTDSATPGTPPVISDVAPDPVERGATLTITGFGFTAANGLLVRLGSLYVNSISVSPNEITLTVPPEAQLGANVVWVVQSTSMSNALSVEIVNPPGAPWISYILPSAAFPGYVISAYGNFPLGGPANTRFYVGTVEAVVQTAGPGGATFVAPDVAPGMYSVTAEAWGYTSNAVDLQVY